METTIMGGDNGKDHGNYYNGLCIHVYRCPSVLALSTTRLVSLPAMEEQTTA